MPSNTALAVGNNIDYAFVRTFNTYTHKPITVILAKSLLNIYFPEKNSNIRLEDYHEGDKNIPFKVIDKFKGKKLVGASYEQLINWVTPEKGAFKVLPGDFVTTEEGTGIVHVAPTFGADDFKIAQQYGIPPLTVIDKNQQTGPLVDKKGRFIRLKDLNEDFIKKYVNVDEYEEFAGRFVKNEYDETLTEKDPVVDIDIAVYLKKDNKAFRIEKHIHNYPHCWRTDKPVLYYPLDSIQRGL